MPRYRKPNYFRSLYLVPGALLAMIGPFGYHYLMSIVYGMGKQPVPPFGGMPVWLVAGLYVGAVVALGYSAWLYYKDHELGEYQEDVLMGTDRYRDSW